MFPGPWTYRELANAAKSRLAFDFDRAAAIMACLSGKRVSPRALNPYRVTVVEFRGDDAARDYRIRAKAGRLITQTISASQVVNDA